jgi:hypothetical protein
MVLEVPKTYLRLTELPSVFDYRFRDRLRILNSLHGCTGLELAGLVRAINYAIAITFRGNINV